MDADPGPVPLAALQHYAYCPRQCGLIHLERVWAENLYTAEGAVLHGRVHETGTESRAGVRVERSVDLRCRAPDLVGRADVVEFHGQGGREVPFPVEYKRGRPKAGDHDRVQICGQALCLEHMLGVDVPRGALFYGKTRRRQEVAFDTALRRRTLEVAGAVRAMFASGALPPPAGDKKRCERCSLAEACLPRIESMNRALGAYLATARRDE